MTTCHIYGENGFTIAMAQLLLHSPKAWEELARNLYQTNEGSEAVSAVGNKWSTQVGKLEKVLLFPDFAKFGTPDAVLIAEKAILVVEVEKRLSTDQLCKKNDAFVRQCGRYVLLMKALRSEKNTSDRNGKRYLEGDRGLRVSFLQRNYLSELNKERNKPLFLMVLSIDGFCRNRRRMPVKSGILEVDKTLRDSFSSTQPPILYAQYLGKHYKDFKLSSKRIQKNVIVEMQAQVFHEDEAA